jgi:hypothetical protein
MDGKGLPDGASRIPESFGEGPRRDSQISQTTRTGQRGEMEQDARASTSEERVGTSQGVRVQTRPASGGRTSVGGADSAARPAPKANDQVPSGSDRRR